MSTVIIIIERNDDAIFYMVSYMKNGCQKSMMGRYTPAVDEAIDDYINYLLKWEHDYPLFKETIDKQIDAINNNREEFVQNYVIPQMPHMTEADFDDEASAGL